MSNINLVEEFNAITDVTGDTREIVKPGKDADNRAWLTYYATRVGNASLTAGNAVRDRNIAINGILVYAELEFGKDAEIELVDMIETGKLVGVSVASVRGYLSYLRHALRAGLTHEDVLALDVSVQKYTKEFCTCDRCVKREARKASAESGENSESGETSSASVSTGSLMSALIKLAERLDDHLATEESSEVDPKAWARLTSVMKSVGSAAKNKALANRVGDAVI